jgi:hypothetical protein
MKISRRGKVARLPDVFGVLKEQFGGCPITGYPAKSNSATAQLVRPNQTGSDL